MQYTVTDSQSGLFGPFPTLGDARKCVRDLDGWTITETETGIVVDCFERVKVIGEDE